MATSIVADTSLVGRAKELEVASILIRNGIYVFWPLVDKGIDLIATNRAATMFVPIQVRYRATGPALDLRRSELPRLKRANSIIAFIRGPAESQHCWFIPYEAWQSRAVDKDRGDEIVYVPIKRNLAWLDQFKGDAGVRSVLRALDD